MAMGTRKQREKQEDLWIAHTELAAAPGHPFYQRLNELLEAEGFDEFVERRCAKFYAARFGRPSLTPGIYFRALLIGFFEGIGAEGGIAGYSAGYWVYWPIAGWCRVSGSPSTRPLWKPTRRCARSCAATRARVM